MLPIPLCPGTALETHRIEHSEARNAGPEAHLPISQGVAETVGS